MRTTSVSVPLQSLKNEYGSQASRQMKPVSICMFASDFNLHLQMFTRKQDSIPSVMWEINNLRCWYFAWKASIPSTRGQMEWFYL